MFQIKFYQGIIILKCYIACNTFLVKVTFVKMGLPET